MDDEMDNEIRPDEMPDNDDSQEKSDEGKSKDEPKGCLIPPPFRRVEELVVEGCICVAMLSLATTALGMILLKDK
ncbi:MAG: hypothetical protein IKP58_00685 [Victivallales bacterium]|jgi:hypothetical protein|nr:hypothetical protein [Victivallales bacterium]